MSFHRSALATLAQATYNCLDSKGFDAAEMFQRAGLDPARMYDPDARFGGAENIRLWRIAVHETRQPCLIYEIVNYVEPWMLHAVGHAWISSHTLLAALQRFERSHRMLSTNVEVKLEKLQGAWQLTGSVVDPIEHPSSDAVLAFTLHMCRKSYGSDLTPMEVQLIRLEPTDAEPLESFFGCEVRYGCSENIIVFNSSDLNRSLRGANPAIANAMDEVIADYLSRFDSRDVVSQVRKIVAGYLVHGEPDREMIARELNLSSRTLQRRLDEQGSSVKQIVDETRHQLALEYLGSVPRIK